MARKKAVPSSAPPNKGTALVLEVLPALLGIFGIGWIYGGRTNTGFMLLIGGLVFIWGGYAAIIIGSTVLTTLTLGLGVFSYCLICGIPLVQVTVAIVSTLALNSELEKN